MKINYLNLFLFITHIKICTSRRYDNYTLYSITPTELHHLNFLQNLETQKYMDVIFWKRPSKLFNDVHLVVNPMDLDLFQERSHHFKLETRVILTDIQRAFDRQVIKNYTSPTIETFSWKFYHNLEDIYQWMSDVSLRFPNFVELHSIGQSVEGRDIYAIYIRKAKGKGNVIVDAGIHGNEWISTAFVTYLIKKLVYVTPEENNRLYNLVMKYHWYLIPVVNPDGYDYSITTDRLWRKNRRLFETGEGVDLNRNFPHNFGKYDTSTNAKDDNYGGPGPFSEQESKVLSDFIIEKRDRLKFYLSFHSYGQKIIIPYDDRVKHVENFSEMDNYAKQAILKMYRIHGVKYGVGTTYDTLGLRISGTSTTWVKNNMKTKYVATFLLRDNGTFGYALPSEEILPTCEETLQGLVELMTARPRRIRSDLFNSAPRITKDIFTIFLTVIGLLN